MQEETMKACLQEIADFFELGKVDNFKKSIYGNNNRTFLVEMEDGGGYAFRLLGEKIDRIVLENERYVQKCILQKNIYTTDMLVASNGSYLFSKDGLRATVSRLIRGWHPEYPVAIEEAYLIGKSLADFHTALTGVSLPHARAENSLSRQKIESRIDKLPRGEYAEKIVELLLRSESEGGYTSLPQGIMHGDFHVNNILCDDQKNIFILDLQGVSMGPLILDLGRSVADVCCEGDALDREKLRSFLAGYESVRPLKTAERKEIDRAIRYGAVVASVSLYERGKYDFANHFLKLGYTVTSGHA